jgi:hypothetical protein
VNFAELGMVAPVEVGAGAGKIAADMDTFGYLGGRIAHLERWIATLESSDRCAASRKAQGN